MDTNKYRVESIVLSILGLLWLGLLLSIGIIYICTDWTPLCNRLATALWAVSMLGLFLCFALNSSDEDTEDTEDVNKEESNGDHKDRRPMS